MLLYSGLVDWAREHMLNPQFPLASREDMKIPLCLNTADEAIAVIRKDHAVWQKSQRKNTNRSRNAR